MIHPHARYPLRLIQASAEAKLHYFRQEFVLRHDHLNSIFDTLLQQIHWPSDKSLCLVVGPTGVGKTTLAHRLIEHFYSSIKLSTPGTTMKAVYLEVPKQSTTKFDWRDFYIRLLSALDEPFPEYKVEIEPARSTNHGPRFTGKVPSESKLRREVEDTLADRQTQWVVLDEIQHLFKSSAGKHDQNLDVLKSLANLTQANFICLGTYESLFYSNWNAQLSRRSLMLEFAPYDWSDLLQQKPFGQTVSGLMAHLPCELEPTLLQDIEFFHLGSIGCVGLLKTWFEQALKQLLHSGGTSLGLEDLRATRPSNREIARIIQEMQEGQRFFQQPSDDELRALLGLKAKDATPVTEKTTKGRRVGERKPHRDKVT